MTDREPDMTESAVTEPDMTESAVTEPSAALRASYDIGGPVGAPVIVFVHGVRLSRSMWAAQMAELGDSHRVIAVDLPGHGTLNARPFTLDGAADQVAMVIETAANGRAVVVGLSLGGYVAMHLAARRPELVRALVVASATAEPVAWRALPFRALAAAFERLEGARLAALNAWFFRSRYPPAIAEPIVAGGFWSVGGTAALRSLVGQRFMPRLAAYPGPTLLLNGAYDLPFRLFASSFARAARASRVAAKGVRHERQVRRVRLAGATHLANLDRPAAFSAAVRGFLQSLDEGADKDA